MLVVYILTADGHGHGASNGACSGSPHLPARASRPPCEPSSAHSAHSLRPSRGGPMNPLRFAGWALLVGAALAFLTDIPITLMFPGKDAVHEALHPLFGPLNLVSAVSAVLVLWGLPTLAAYGAKELGWSGIVGALLIFVVAAMLGVFLGLVRALLDPFLAQQAPELIRGG